MMTDTALTVSQLNLYIKMQLEADSRLKHVCLVGEVSNFVHHYKSGHCYFSLKDDHAAVKAVMFRQSAQFLKFTPENGMRVYVLGRVSVFERDGVYQLYVDSMEPEGAGAWMAALEQLKKKLTAEGLFDAERKRPIPAFPKKIAVVTSPVGAAVQDVINILSRRWPLAEVLLCPVAAQGVRCVSENIRALERLNKREDVDTVILCRGGGSLEDLWGYNDEQLVRAVAASRVPVITGIGHEVDFTLCDFAADLRAPTPSAAAELAVPDIAELFQVHFGCECRLQTAVQKYLEEKESALRNLLLRLQVRDPKITLEKQRLESSALRARLLTAAEKYFQNCDTALQVLSEKLRLLSPLAMMDKGFIPVYYKKKRVKSVGALDTGCSVELRFCDGSALCDVKQIQKTESGK